MTYELICFAQGDFGRECLELFDDNDAEFIVDFLKFYEPEEPETRDEPFWGTDDEVIQHNDYFL